jgi:3'-5' exoribonuclease
MATTSHPTTGPEVRDLEDGSAVDQVLLVRDRELRQTRAGADFMRLSLADRTGAVTGLVWDDVQHASDTARIGEPVRVTGSFQRHPRYGAQVTIAALEVPQDVNWERLLDGPATSIVELERGLDAILHGIEDPHLRRLMERLLGHTSAGGGAYRRAFAAQYNHHAYRGGLLEHSLQVADATAHAAGTFAGIDRELAICGALLHDIGKLDAYSGDACGVTLNDSGRLIGEIPSGYYTVRRAIEQVPGFPPKRAQALLHIILSHHGCFEHGSPVLPSTREALVVHAMDKLSGDLGSFDRLERETAENETWSRFDRALGRAVLLADRAPHQHARQVTQEREMAQHSASVRDQTTPTPARVVELRAEPMATELAETVDAIRSIGSD